MEEERSCAELFSRVEIQFSSRNVQEILLLLNWWCINKDIDEASILKKHIIENLRHLVTFSKNETFQLEKVVHPPSVPDAKLASTTLPLVGHLDLLRLWAQ